MVHRLRGSAGSGTARSGLGGGCLRRLRPRPLTSHEDGFTLVELVIAMFIVTVILTSMLALFVASIRTVTLARERQTATALATQVLEQVRALPYNDVVKGLDSTDLTGDPFISGGRLVYPAGSIDEVLRTSTPTASPAPGRGPLSPHRLDVRPEGAGRQLYTVRSYVTAGATTQPSYNLTAIVSWTSNVTRGTQSVVQRSTSYSPSGCLDTATHPFAGPCQAFYSAQAGLTAASISVTNTTDSQQPVPGLSGTSVSLFLPALGSDLGVEQVTKLTAVTQTSKAQTSAGGTSGGQASSSAAEASLRRVRPRRRRKLYGKVRTGSCTVVYCFNKF